MKVALITGASGAIGRETALKFINDGYFTVGQYNNGGDRMENFVSALKNENKSDYFFPFRADLKSSKDCAALAEFTLENFGHTDVFVSVAGTDVYKLCTETTEKEWDDVFSVNAKSAFLLTKSLLPAMTERKKGALLYVSSIWGVAGACMETAYSASKAALIGFCKAIAKEVAPSGITANCVCPGVIDTPMNARFSAEETAELIERTPLGRLGTAKEIADLIIFLCTGAPFVTGQAITADGGFIL